MATWHKDAAENEADTFEVGEGDEEDYDEDDGHTAYDQQ